MENDMNKIREEVATRYQLFKDWLPNKEEWQFLKLAFLWYLFVGFFM